ncbi:MAG: sodium-translocating pyrophosphatase [Candidatus Thermofonsia Clade 1 bacterium]|uniref:Putative K(+)-stimulated pyrophosphate-energized sodium pump n=1 Tax=Candidatus Thermofonsia Clade 1 bacterium TaxID=2364210 RepID=A0A2M8P2X0_9CHLR|nr:MAG: sodium-translocating pyrophosphatase [Candidatus Thermofonsia Clade 1 bacterium]
MEFFVENARWIASIIAIGGLIFAFRQRAWVMQQDPGNETMQRIARAVQQGAAAFLRREYVYVAIFVVLVSALLLGLSSVQDFNLSPWTVVAFVSGALASGLAGFFGMQIAVRANSRTTQAASQSLDGGLRVAFASGSVMGTTVVSLALLGIGLLIVVLSGIKDNPQEMAGALTGFGFGGTAIAIFARVGGGIFTKAADVGADLVGKTEAGIPEDDPRNPAVIADNVGDNVGDVAGMGSDLFESYASSIIAAISLAVLSSGVAVSEAGSALGIGIPPEKSGAAQAYPLLIAALGLIVSIGSTFLVRAQEGATQGQLLGSLRRGVYSASAIIAILMIAVALLLDLGIGVALAAIAGLLAGAGIGFSTEYFTSDNYRPTRYLAESSEGGPAIVIIQGIALGMLSVVVPALIVIAATLVAYSSAGLYGVAIAAVGMLSTLSITLATDAYGPVADNAGGIAEMSHMGKEVRERTDALDSLGNTTAAVGKGFAIGSALMTALALIAAFVSVTGIREINILDPRLITGFILGGMLPLLFSAQTMTAVGKAARGVVVEVRRQFKEIPGLMEGKADPDYARCVAISTDNAIRQMILPGTLAVAIPVLLILGARLARGTDLERFLGAETVVGMLIGSLLVAFMVAVLMANAGGAWDNAKKYIERGNLGGKGSAAHKAAVVGDTVGDPFKDTSGPSLNILLKLLAIVSLVMAPLLR